MSKIILLRSDQEMIWKASVCNKGSGKWVFLKGRKNKKYIILCVNNCSKVRKYTVLNTMSRDCNSEISELRYSTRIF